MAIERAVPGEASRLTMAHHEARYRFAQTYCDGKVVLDAGCGAGYGTARLASAARLVVALDLSLDAVQHAAAEHRRENIIFVAARCESLPFAASAFDVVCLFEVIEHVPDDERLMAEVCSVVKPDGVLIASTPNRLGSTEPESNPFHLRAYSEAEFRAFLERWFADVCILHQVPGRVDARSVARRLDVFGLRRLLCRGSLAVRLKDKLLPRAHATEFVQPDGDGPEPDYITAVCRK